VSAKSINLAWTCGSLTNYSDGDGEQKDLRLSSAKSLALTKKALFLLCERMAMKYADFTEGDSIANQKLGELGTWPFAARIIGLCLHVGTSKFIDYCDSFGLTATSGLDPSSNTTDLTMKDLSSENSLIELLSFSFSCLQQLLRLLMTKQFSACRFLDKDVNEIAEHRTQDLNACFTVSERKSMQRNLVLILHFVERLTKGEFAAQIAAKMCTRTWDSLTYPAAITLLRLVRADDHTQTHQPPVSLFCLRNTSNCCLLLFQTCARFKVSDTKTGLLTRFDWFVLFRS
jgi:hypothetical protein